MSHQKHAEHGHHNHQTHPKRPIHHKWWFWVAVVLMLVAMVGYVVTMDEAIGPGGRQAGPEVPAAG